MSAFGIVFLVLGLLLGSVIVALAMPFDVDFYLDIPDDGGQVKVTWMFGAVVLFSRGADQDAKRRRKEKRKHKRKATRAKKRRAHDAQGLLAPEVRSALFSLFGRLVRKVRIRALWLRIVLGLEDPADTAVVHGVLQPLAAAIGGVSAGTLPRRRRGFAFEPRFDGEILKIEGRGHLRAVPLRIVAVGVAFVLSRRGWMVIRALRRAFWKKANPS